MIERIRRFDIVLLDLFSGIGGFTKGLEDAGFNIVKHYYSEIDKHAIANYRYNYEKAECVGSISDLGGGSITRPDIITFGSPCQDFSMAGKRTGIKGQRSSLIGQALRIIKECRPEFFIWENVKGVFSSNSGADFWAIIQAFANIGGYRLEWQLVNTAWVLPQNRERIYLIGHLAKAGRDFRGVFPFREVDFRNDELGKFNETINIRTLSAGGYHSAMTLVRHRSTEPYKEADCSPAIRNSDKAEVRIVASRGRNPRDSSDRTTGSPTEQRLEINENGTTNTLTGVQKDNLVVVGVPTYHATELFMITCECGTAYKGTLQTICPRCGEFRGGYTNEIIEVSITDDNYPNRTREYMDRRTTIHSKAGNLKVSNIRRLTEIECERLQGFPDNWTEYGNYDGVVRKIPKTQRYKLLGNAVTVKIVEEIGKRLIKNFE